MRCPTRLLVATATLLAAGGCTPNKADEAPARSSGNAAGRSTTPGMGMAPVRPGPARPAALSKAQAERRRRVKRELDRYDDLVLRFDASKLGAADKKLIGVLLEAVAVVDELNKVQINPNDLRYGAEIAAHGTADDKRLFKRYQMPWCTDDENRLCNADRRLVPKKIGLYHWPYHMTDADFAKISAAPNSKVLLSPFTVVRRAMGADRWRAIPFAADPLFQPRLKKLAALLVRAAGITTEPTLQKFLRSRAKALLTPAPFPYDASDYDWIALKGRFEVNVGPYEVYHNPRLVKARFKMVFGVEDPAITAKLSRFGKVLQQMENALARLVGTKIYKPRKLDPRIAVRAIQVIASGGDARKAHGATVAFHLPNRGKSVDEGLYKKVMLVNHSTAFEKIMKRRAALVLDPAQQKYVSTISDITNTTFHEFAHGFGAHDELKIRTRDGKQTTVHGALREHATLVEELKADVTSMWLIAQSVKRGWLKPEEARSRYVSGLMHILGLASYPLKGTYPRMTSVQLGWYLDHGGVVWDKGHFKVDFAKLPKAVESLTKLVATLQLTGDYAGASKLIGRYVRTVVPKKEYAFAGKLAQPMKQTKAAFKKANIKSVAIRYKVTGL